MDAIQNIAEQGAALVRNQPILSALAAFGTLKISRVLLQSVIFVLQTFILSGRNIKSFGAKSGAWAVVTGASDGIGKEFAFQLAKAGYNVLLIARNQGVLNATASEISTKYSNVQAKTLAMDFVSNDERMYGNLAAAISGIDVGVLVNNVGRSHSMPVDFVDTPKDEMESILTININATLRVTYTVLPGMIQRKRGLILNIGSFAGANPSPMLTTYSASKAFLSTFTGSLAEEVKAHNIVVEHINSYMVVSKLSKIRRPSTFTPLPAAFVKSVLSKIGLACGSVGSGRMRTSTPFWSHAVMDYAMTTLLSPRFIVEYTHKMHKDLRRRALKKAEREAKSQ